MQRFVSLILMTLLLGTTARAYNLTVTLAQTNQGVPNAAAGADARWMTDRMNVWHMSGTAEVFTVAGQIAIYFNEVPGLYSPATSNLTLNTGEMQVIAYYRPWTNHISVTVTPNTAPWSISGTFPSTFTLTNGVGNLSATKLCPTGAVYIITYSRLQEYYLPATNSINVSGPGVDATFATNYVAYSNSLAVTVAGVSSTNVLWSLAGPEEFTNASSYGATFTNSYTVTAIPTGSYTITFPAIAGYTNPAAVTTNITDASPLVNAVTGTYAAVIWYSNTNSPSTNPPIGQLPTNFPVTTNDITLMVTTNGLFKTPSREKIIAANGLLTNGAAGPAGPTGAAATIAIAWVSNGVPGSAATVTNVGDSNAAQFGFIIPVGSNGADGAVGPQGPAGTNGATGPQGPAGPITNQIITHLGITYTITNDPTASGDVLKFDPATSNAWFAPDGGGDSGTAEQGTYPVFILPVGIIDGAWTDFELKASTNNFASSPIYYFKSWVTNNPVNGDTNALVYFTDDYSDDVRVWRSTTNGAPIASKLTDTLSVVQYVCFMPSHDCAVDWSTWMQATNKNLVWSWVRVDAGNFEMNAGDTKQRWNPIRPESWEVGRTTP